MSEEKKPVDFKQIRRAVRGAKQPKAHASPEDHIEIPEKPKGVSVGYHEWDCPQCLGANTLKLENIEKSRGTNSMEGRTKGSFTCKDCGCIVFTNETSGTRTSRPHLQMPDPVQLNMNTVNIREATESIGNMMGSTTIRIDSSRYQGWNVGNNATPVSIFQQIYPTGRPPMFYFSYREGDQGSARRLFCFFPRCQEGIAVLILGNRIDQVGILSAERYRQLRDEALGSNEMEWDGSRSRRTIRDETREQQRQQANSSGNIYQATFNLPIDQNTWVKRKQDSSLVHRWVV